MKCQNIESRNPNKSNTKLSTEYIKDNNSIQDEKARMTETTSSLKEVNFKEYF